MNTWPYLKKQKKETTEELEKKWDYLHSQIKLVKDYLFGFQKELL